MSALQFDELNGFDGSLEDFLKHMESIDAALGKILRDNIGELKGATYEKARKDARDSFNAKVVAALDALKKRSKKMSRYFLTRICVEGFRGINNEGEPLELKFKTNSANSVYAINGTGKSSLFDALCYAICGDIPKLGKLQAIEKPEDYYANKFHSQGTAIIILDFESDDATSQKVSIQVARAADGTRTVTSPSGHADPNGFLESLNESFTLLDYETFSTFIDHTPLERGRSFSSLLGLAVYSDFRQTLKTAIDTRALNSDLDISSLTFQAQSSKDATALAVTKLETNFNALVGRSIEDVTKLAGYKDEAMKTLGGIRLLGEELSGKTIDEVDFDELNKIIKAAEGGKERVELAKALNTLAKLDEVEDDDLEAIKTKSLNIKLKSKTSSSFIKKLKVNFVAHYTRPQNHFSKSGEWDDDHECPVCSQHSDDDLSESVGERVKEYKDVDDAVATFQTKWQQSSWRLRLLALETLVTPDLQENQKLFRPYDNAIISSKLSMPDYVKLVEYYEKLEARYTAAVAKYTKSKNDIEAKLPKSLVTLTKQVECAKLFREACNDYDTASKNTIQQARSLRYVNDGNNLLPRQLILTQKLKRNYQNPKSLQSKQSSKTCSHM
ncbi:AAA family ATPase [Candidatus Saccharibacteria bacterium]|nr:MAG: AAA family ATPase [Candidatus Saccharibacteria bacterium]